MTWATLAPIIAQYGMEVAYSIWGKWQSGALPTQADWDVLLKLGKRTPEDAIKDAANRAGLAADNPKVLELLALVKAP